jgi:hypothetical protein
MGGNPSSREPELHEIARELARFLQPLLGDQADQVPRLPDPAIVERDEELLREFVVLLPTPAQCRDKARHWEI